MLQLVPTFCFGFVYLMNVSVMGLWFWKSMCPIHQPQEIKLPLKENVPTVEKRGELGKMACYIYVLCVSAGL